jgi:cell division protein FtsL
MATAYQWSGLGREALPVAGHSRFNQARKPQLVPPPSRQTVAQPNRKKKPVMVEFYTLKRIDNSRLVRRVEPVKLRKLYKTVMLGGIIAACFMLYAYQHFRCIDLSFQLEGLRAKQEQAQGMNSKLKLDIAFLRDPHRIDVIARHQLGLTQPTASQVREYAGVDGAEVAAVQYVRPNRAP